jgi:hypothetical protein
LIFKRNVVTKTRYPFVWGWHTSDEIWHKSRGLVKDIDDYELIAKLRQLPSWNQHFEDFWLMMLQSCKDVENARDAGALDSLDYTIGMRRWVKNSWATPYVLNYWMFSETLGALRPPINLVENIGFGDLATHTTRRPPHARKLETRRLNSLSLDADEKTNLDYAEDRIVFGVQP